MSVHTFTLQVIFYFPKSTITIEQKKSNQRSKQYYFPMQAYLCFWAKKLGDHATQTTDNKIFFKVKFHYAEKYYTKIYTKKEQ